MSTRKAASRAVREADLRESLEFARRHLAPAEQTRGYAGVRVAARLRARCAATCERVAHRSEQNRRQLFDDVSR